jgi:hypothetical protein
MKGIVRMEVKMEGDVKTHGRTQGNQDEENCLKWRWKWKATSKHWAKHKEIRMKGIVRIEVK